MSKTNGTKAPISNNRINYALGEIRNDLISRSSLIRLTDTEGKKNVDTECEYPIDISTEDYWKMYLRNGVARRVVNVFPSESWALNPEIYETEEMVKTEFETAWDNLLTQHNCFHYLCRADKVSGIGQFALMLLGLDDGKALSSPIEGVQKDGTIKPSKKAHKLLFLRVIPQALCEVKTWEMDTKSTRFGQPLTYSVKFGDMNDQTGVLSTIGGEEIVHWSRVIHCADNLISSEVLGTPRMEPVYNYLLDIKKTLGGSAEMFWKGGFPGLATKMSPEVAAAISALTPAEQEEVKRKMREEFQEYQLGLQRYLAMVGVDVTSLTPQIAEPTAQLDAHLTVICITIEIPKRIFMGSERGELASGQDTEHWNKRIKSRQNEYMIPKLIRPFIDRLILLGILPTPKAYFISWPDISTPGELDVATIAQRLTAALAMYVKGNVARLIPPMEYFTTVLKLPLVVAQMLTKAMEDQQAKLEKSGLIIPNPDPNANNLAKGGVGVKKGASKQTTNPKSQGSKKSSK